MKVASNIVAPAQAGAADGKIGQPSRGLRLRGGDALCFVLAASAVCRQLLPMA